MFDTAGRKSSDSDDERDSAHPSHQIRGVLRSHSPINMANVSLLTWSFGTKYKTSCECEHFSVHRKSVSQQGALREMAVDTAITRTASGNEYELLS